jgi:hypothetical protein
MVDRRDRAGAEGLRAMKMVWVRGDGVMGKRRVESGEKRVVKAGSRVMWLGKESGDDIKIETINSLTYYKIK